VIMHQPVGYTKPQLSVPAPSFEAVQALAASRVVLGDNHPDTIEVMNGPCLYLGGGSRGSRERVGDSRGRVGQVRLSSDNCRSRGNRQQTPLVPKAATVACHRQIRTSGQPSRRKSSGIQIARFGAESGGDVSDQVANHNGGSCAFWGKRSVTTLIVIGRPLACPSGCRGRQALVAGAVTLGAPAM
jgi:hypothetical protein